MGLPVNLVSSIRKNLLINGNFDFWQRATSFTYSGTGTLGSYSGADRWAYGVSTTNARSGSVVRSTNVPTAAQSGFQSQYSFQHTVTSSFVLGAADYFSTLVQRIEGQNYARIHGGKQCSLNFWFTSTVAGTYPISMTNQTSTRSYVSTFVYAAANVWQYVSIPFLSDTANSYNFDNTIGLAVFICPQAGATYQTSVLNVWQTGNFVNPPTGIQLSSNAGLVFNVAQVSLVEGTSNSSSFARAGNDIANELVLCQRYFEKSYSIDAPLGQANNLSAAIKRYYATTYFVGSSDVSYKVCKRSTSTITFINAQTGVSGSIAEYNGGSVFNASRSVGNSGSNSTNGFTFQSANGDWTAGYFYCLDWTADAEL
jgi:hypothetical protein